MAYGQQSALFWAIVQSIKKLFAGRPIEQTCNRSPQRHSPGGWLLSLSGWGRGRRGGRETVGGWEITSFIELGST